VSQTPEGAKKAYQSRLSRHGLESIRKMQSKGGSKSTPGGFGTKKIGEDGLTGRQRARLASIESHRVRKHNYSRDYEEEILDGAIE
jgi:hypothetical protein